MHPIALHAGALTVTWYGVMVALGFMAGLWSAGRRAPRAGIAGEKIIDLGPWLIGGAILGARALYVVSYWQESFAGGPWWEIFAVWKGGLVFYGGLIGASLAGIFYSRAKSLPLWGVADILAPSIALGHAIGRIGCLLNGCCYGRACSLPWAIRYPAGHQTHPLKSPATPVHPTQVYESLLNLALYAGLAWLFRRRRFSGQVFAAYLISYAALRSFVEMFRGDYPQYYLGGLVTPGQLVSLGVLIAGLALLWRLPRQPVASAK
jgi:phosphatidylglycerol---prolipoprotein diacylglyceryl transferase